MKILLINKFYFPKGGADKMFINTADLLAQNGFEPVVFSMRHSKNLSSPFEKYFAPFVPTHKFSLRTHLRALYNRSAAKNLQRLIYDEKPDVALVFNIYHQLSPSVLNVLKKNNIPVVMFAHDYKLICPNYQLDKDNHKCPQNKFLHALDCVFHRRHKNSFILSLAVSLEWLFYTLLNIYKKNVDVLAVPSRFVADAFIKRGWPEQKIKVVPNYTDMSAPVEKGGPDENYLLFAGRLSEEKGLDVLEKLAGKLPDVLFYAAGEGEYKLSPLSNIVFLGPQTTEELKKLYRNAAICLVPSKANETFSLAVLEAMSQGTPVVASNRGAIPELIKPGQNGYLFDPFTNTGIDKAAGYIRALWQNVDLRKQIGENNLNKAKNYSPDAYLSSLKTLMDGLVNKSESIDQADSI